MPRAPTALGGQSIAGTLRHVFCQGQVIVAPMHTATFDLATDLRARHGLKTPDALHLATALEQGCDEFWTRDRRLESAAGTHLRVVTFVTTP